MIVTLFIVFLSMLILNDATGTGSCADKLIQRLQRLRDRCGFAPTHILDVGANEGKWSMEVKNNVFPNAQYFMIEGNTQCSSALSEHKWATYEIALVGKEVTNITFFTINGGSCGKGTGNGIFRETSRHYVNAVEETRTLNTIDRIVLSKNFGPVQFMKLDIQGAEVPALLGAFKTLEHVEVLFTEAPIANYNENAPGYFKLMHTIHHLGFDMFDITDLSYDNAQDLLLQFDIIWVKRTSSLWGEKCTGYPPRRYSNFTD